MEASVSDAVPSAVTFLLKHGIKLVEYGQQTMPKYGYPQVPLKLEYVVSDDELKLSSELLEKNGFRSIPSDPLLQEVYGDLETKSHYHISTLNETANEVPIQLLPSSLVHLHPDNVERQSFRERSDPAVLPLSLPQQCISLIRTIVDHPPRSASRAKPILELTVLIAYGIFEYQYYDKDWYAPPEESEEDFQRNVRIALEKVRSWDLPGDAAQERKLLESLVAGIIRVESIPWNGDASLLKT